MIFRNLLILISFLCFCLPSTIYSQTSVCSLNGGNFSFGNSFLMKESDNIYQSENYNYEHDNSYWKFGINYGYREDVKISIIPDFKLESSNLSDPSIGFQVMKYSGVPDRSLDYFGVFSASARYSDHIEDSYKDHNISTKFIGGPGLYFKKNILSKFSVIAFLDVYYEGRIQKVLYKTYIDGNTVSDTPILSYLHNAGTKMGLEFNVNDKLIFIFQWNPSFKDPEGSLKFSVCSRL